MTWIDRIILAVLFIACMLGVSWIAHALAANGYYWTMGFIIIAMIAGGYLVDWRAGRIQLWRNNRRQ